MVHTPTMGDIDALVSQLPAGDRVQVPELSRISGAPYASLDKAFRTGVIQRENRRGWQGSTVSRDDAVIIICAVVLGAIAGIAFLDALRALKAAPAAGLKVGPKLPI